MQELDTNVPYFCDHSLHKCLYKQKCWSTTSHSNACVYVTIQDIYLGKTVDRDRVAHKAIYIIRFAAWWSPSLDGKHVWNQCAETTQLVYLGQKTSNKWIFEASKYLFFNDNTSIDVLFAWLSPHTKYNSRGWTQLMWQPQTAKNRGQFTLTAVFSEQTFSLTWSTLIQHSSKTVQSIFVK